MIIDFIENDIFRLKISFEVFTTSVYFYVCKQGIAIIDCGTYASDVDEYIIPSLNKLNISADAVKFILIYQWII